MKTLVFTFILILLTSLVGASLIDITITSVNDRDARISEQYNDYIYI
jgi:hypothetical protein